MTDTKNLELAISRIVDRDDNATDWLRLEEAQKLDGKAFGDLLESLKADAVLRSFVRQDAESLEDVNLPLRPQTPRPKAKPFPGFLKNALMISAAALFGLWLGGRNTETPTVAPSSTEVQLSSDEALQVFVRNARSEGRDLSILADVVLSVVPREEDSKIELTTLMRVVEKRLVDGVMETKVDDGGRMVAMPVPRDRLTTPRSF